MQFIMINLLSFDIVFVYVDDLNCILLNGKHEICM